MKILESMEITFITLHMMITVVNFIFLFTPHKKDIVWFPDCLMQLVFPLGLAQNCETTEQAVACISTNRVRGCATHLTCGGTNFKTEV